MCMLPYRIRLGLVEPEDEIPEKVSRELMQVIPA